MAAFPSGYFRSPWPAEDAGPQRLQQPWGATGLNLQAGERLACTTRNTLLSTMTVLGDPGQVYLLTMVTLNRQAVFEAFEAARCLIRTLSAEDRLGRAST